MAKHIEYLVFNPAENTYGIQELEDPKLDDPEEFFNSTGSIVQMPADARQKTLDEIFAEQFPDIKAKKVLSDVKITFNGDTYVLPWVAYTTDGTAAAIMTDDSVPIQKIGKAVAIQLGKPTNFYTPSMAYMGSAFPGRR